MVKVKLTVRSIEASKAGDRDVILWDTELAGFGCKITPKGKRSFFLYYRTKDGQQRRPTIGGYDILKPEAARAVAREWLATVAMGGDPSLKRVVERAAPTVRELCERYMDEHAEPHKKASSAAGDRRLISLHIIPAIGARKVASVTRADVAAIHLGLRGTPYEANRVLALASKMFSLSEAWGLRTDGSNPASNIRRFREEKRERYLSPDELSRLWTLLESEEAATLASPAAIAAVKLLMLTGRRLSEVLSLEWAWIDMDRPMLNLPDTKTGALRVPLGAATIELLRTLRTANQLGRFVIPGSRSGCRLINLQKPWRRLRAKAGLTDVRIHDLRHTYASVGAGLGLSLPMLGKLLGHTQAATTSRYAHLAIDPTRIAADAIGAELMRMTGT